MGRVSPASQQQSSAAHTDAAARLLLPGFGHDYGLGVSAPPTLFSLSVPTSWCLPLPAPCPPSPRSSSASSCTPRRPRSWWSTTSSWPPTWLTGSSCTRGRRQSTPPHAHPSPCNQVRGAVFCGLPTGLSVQEHQWQMSSRDTGTISSRGPCKFRPWSVLLGTHMQPGHSCLTPPLTSFTHALLMSSLAPPFLPPITCCLLRLSPPCHQA
jgi:hypothetical protein